MYVSGLAEGMCHGVSGRCVKVSSSSIDKKYILACNYYTTSAKMRSINHFPYP